jgi:hypothetical protein
VLKRVHSLELCVLESSEHFVFLPNPEAAISGDEQGIDDVGL